MTKALLRLRFQAFFSSMLRTLKTKKKMGRGIVILFCVMLAYIAVVFGGMMAMLFSSLAQPYHQLGLDWLYFSTAGTLALGVSVLASVFSTQSQLYDAKDNALLLSMPIPPRKILMSRMIPLLAMTFSACLLVILPATAVYCVKVAFLPLPAALQLLICLPALCLLSQGMSCLFGWLLHLLLQRFNRAAASLIFMILFLGAYFGIYAKAGDILNSMAANGAVIADAMRSWVWPLYAMGKGATGDLLLLLAFLGICLAVFLSIYGFLSATFLRHATSGISGVRRKKKASAVCVSSVGGTLTGKELRRFLSSPVYLTNMGMGLVMAVILTAAGILFRDSIYKKLGPMLPLLQPYTPAVLVGILSMNCSMTCISAPSISLEGKSLWILKSLPLSARQILLAKLRFHIVMTVPVMLLSGAVLGFAYGCTPLQILPVALIPALLAVVSGLLGLLSDLKWARFDWISEAYPCKQAVPVCVTLFSVMGLVLALGVSCYLIIDILSMELFLYLAAGLIAVLAAILFRILTHWGFRRWEQLQV